MRKVKFDDKNCPGLANAMELARKQYDVALKKLHDVEMYKFQETLHKFVLDKTGFDLETTKETLHMDFNYFVFYTQDEPPKCESTSS